ncbi:MAG: UTP--glucose-1-phosphate uridylyltransferase [Dehalococcoidia bacterium]
MKIRKAVIPAAGLGTRFLPVTMSVPKELLPIIDRPLLQYVVAEAAEAGVEEVIIVTSPGKESISDYFQPHAALEQRLAASGDNDLLAKVAEAAGLARVSFVIQHEALGLGHAVLMAKDAVGGEPFVVILPDDIIAHVPGAVAQMVQALEQLDPAKSTAGIIAVEELPWEVIHNYGVVDGTRVSDRVHSIQGLVEKPPREQAPSNLTIVGRYILPPQIFECLENTRPGAKGEIQLTDGLLALLQDHELYAYQFMGKRFDGGTPMGLLRASLAFALDRDDTQEEALSLLREFRDRIDPPSSR